MSSNTLWKFAKKVTMPSSSRSALRFPLTTTQRLLARRWLSTTSNNDKKPFEKVLIANRGEISQRVARTCHDLGIKTVAVFSTADAQAPFVQYAQEKVCVGPAASKDSYLNVDHVLEAIHMTGAQAVHPGYGFLSENADFAETITKHGVAWLGPQPDAVRDMGDKLRSKLLAERAGVSTVPGYDGPVENVQHAIQVANDIGYPILLKAASGGGGKGMRVCRTDQDMKDAFPMATAEATNFFKDPRLLVEKFIVNPHHIEFQVLSGVSPTTGDLDILVFCERECSIQRRHQKIIEESPSVLLSEKTRLNMVEQVKALVRQVGYTSAGTVEFLVDEDENFYFLEMNTRLQVEHPITEAVSGNVDLVKGMLHVGAGWGIPQDMLDALGDRPYYPHHGHAVEARIYAEDPLRGFLPSTGPLLPYREPSHLPGIRIDSGVAEGHNVTTFYDPMLSKIICYSPNDRTEAVLGLANALDQYVIEGVQHNARLVNNVLRHPAFLEGKTPTSFLPTHYPDGFQGVQLTTDEQEELGAIVAAVHQARIDLFKSGENTEDEPVVIVKLGGMFGHALKVELLDETTVKVEWLNHPEGEFESRILALDAPMDYEIGDLMAHVSFNDKPRTVQILNEDVSGEMKVQMYGADMKVLVQTPREHELSKFMHEPVALDTSNMVLSPMPGTLVKFSVEEGDHVEDGQELCIVEAMKMQNIIRSPKAGTIAKCAVVEGSSVMADQVIVEFVKDTSEEKVTARAA